MPWQTPTLRSVREMVRDQIAATLPGANFIGNNVLRVMADAKAGLAHLVLRYIDWLSKQFLPDTAETEWLARHGVIWLKNADGTKGRKPATMAAGVVTLTGDVGAVVPVSTQLVAANGTRYETVAEIVLGSVPTTVGILAIDAGAAGNQEAGTSITLTTIISGVDANATVVSLVGGTDAESDANLRQRVLERIQQPPMGGAAHDYVRWAKEVPGVTRAWCAPNEMGPGTVTLRFMMDELRSGAGGFPEDGDIDTVAAYLDTKRPVAVKDFFVVSPIPEPIDFTLADLDPDSTALRGSIDVAVASMIASRAAPAFARNGILQPAQTIHQEWVSAAIMGVVGMHSFNLTMIDHVMPTNGHIAVPGTVIYV